MSSPTGVASCTMLSGRLRDLSVQLSILGPRGVVAVARRNRSGSPIDAYPRCREITEGRRALEIGGPSAVFARGGILPVYPHLAHVDNCDFSGETVWHGEAREGTPFVFDPTREPGTRIVREATSLDGLEDGAYDLVLASHVIEHLADPLLALAEWRRVVGPAGYLILVVPHLENTFDHRRPVTTIEHLVLDRERRVGEDDPTHVREFIDLCDLRRVPERLTRRDLERRVHDQAATRSVHHHVFDTELVARLLDAAGCRLVWLGTALPFHIVAVARADAGGETNDDFFGPSAAWRGSSVFRRDRRASVGPGPPGAHAV